jgi:hypothetical protein
MADKVYAEGLYGKEREGQKPFVVGNMSIQKERFIEWLSGVAADDEGYVRLNVCRQKADALKWSVSLDTWKPREAQQEAPSAPASGGSEGEDSLPF